MARDDDISALVGHYRAVASPLRAFLRVVPDVLSAIRKSGGDAFEASSIHDVIELWGEYIGDARFETDGEWRQKLAGGTRARPQDRTRPRW